MHVEATVQVLQEQIEALQLNLRRLKVRADYRVRARSGSRPSAEVLPLPVFLHLLGFQVCQPELPTQSRLRPSVKVPRTLTWGECEAICSGVAFHRFASPKRKRW